MKDELQLNLVHSIQIGDSEAEKELFLKYKDPIYWKVCRYLSSDIDDIKDLVSEIYLAILKSIRKKSFQPDKWASLDAFIWGVTRNKIRDWVKKKSTKNKYIHPDPPPEELSAEVDNFLLETKDLKKMINNIINKLEPKYKIVLYLRYYQELSIKKISKEIGIPSRRVSERIHYALKLMQKECNKQKIFSIDLLFWLLLQCDPGHLTFNNYENMIK